jgi:hypothetical protein
VHCGKTLVCESRPDRNFVLMLLVGSPAHFREQRSADRIGVPPSFSISFNVSVPRTGAGRSEGSLGIAVWTVPCPDRGGPQTKSIHGARKSNESTDRQSSPMPGKRRSSDRCPVQAVNGRAKCPLTGCLCNDFVLRYGYPRRYLDASGFQSHIAAGWEGSDPFLHGSIISWQESQGWRAANRGCLPLRLAIRCCVKSH